jgi:hypothetical protein
MQNDTPAATGTRAPNFKRTRGRIKAKPFEIDEHRGLQLNDATVRSEQATRMYRVIEKLLDNSPSRSPMKKSPLRI